MDSVQMTRTMAIAALAAAALGGLSGRAFAAAPDPVFAVLLSGGSTVIPLGTSAGLLFFGRGTQEGLRFDLGMASLALGSSIGPSVGQIYGEGGVDAVVTFVLRTITAGVMTVGAGFALRGDDSTKGAGQALFVLGAIPTTFLAIWDIIGAGSSAREARYQEGHGSSSLEPNIISLLRCPGPIPCL